MRKKINIPRKASAATARKSKDTIDFSDIPEARAQDWNDARRGVFFRPVKRQITLRLDADILAWFKSHPAPGKGYQTSINHALREYVAEHTDR